MMKSMSDGIARKIFIVNSMMVSTSSESWENKYNVSLTQAHLREPEPGGPGFDWNQNLGYNSVLSPGPVQCTVTVTCALYEDRVL